jgi:hypothetical protein
MLNPEPLKDMHLAIVHPNWHSNAKGPLRKPQPFPYIPVKAKPVCCCIKLLKDVNIGRGI